MERRPAEPVPTLEEIARALEQEKAPPMTTASASGTRSANIRIDRQGQWFHDGRPIRRERLVRLFASVLQVDEQGQGWLVTPAERLSIEIEDAPFVAIDVRRLEAPEGPALVFTTNLGERITADREHPIEMLGGSNDAEGFRPYLRVRKRIYALILRSTYHQLAEFVDERDGALGVVSRGIFMPLESDATR